MVISWHRGGDGGAVVDVPEILGGLHEAAADGDNRSGACGEHVLSREGGEGAADLARLVVDTIEQKPSQPLNLVYDDEDTIETKIEKVCKNIYGAASISFAAPAKKKLQMIRDLGYENFPICIAKTQFSFSTDAKQYCVASGFDVNVRDIVINAGAEMIVVIAGNIMRMPGLPKVPAAMNMDIVNGQIEGLS